MAGKPGRSGRRLRLSKEVQDAIVRHIRTGGIRKHAVAAAGIANRTFEVWMSRGEAGEKPYVEFYDAVRKAQAEDALRLQSVITRAAMGPHAGDWKAAAWSLEKKYPKEYGHFARNAAQILVAAGSGESGGGDAQPKVTFYLPDNGRRPDDDGEEEDA